MHGEAAKPYRAHVSRGRVGVDELRPLGTRWRSTERGRARERERAGLRARGERATNGVRPCAMRRRSLGMARCTRNRIYGASVVAGATQTLISTPILGEVLGGQRVDAAPPMPAAKKPWNR